MKLVDVQGAGRRLEELVEHVQLGEEFLITRADVPVAKLVSILPDARARQPRSAKGAFVVPADFDAPIPEDLLGWW